VPLIQTTKPTQPYPGDIPINPNTAACYFMLRHVHHQSIPTFFPFAEAKERNYTQVKRYYQSLSSARSNNLVSIYYINEYYVAVELLIPELISIR
jgi:hypothetical protein